jgi:hypothetical protein
MRPSVGDGKLLCVLLTSKFEEVKVIDFTSIAYKGKEFRGVNIPANEFFESPRAVDIMIIFKSRAQKTAFLELVDDNKDPASCKIGPFSFKNCYFYSVTDSARCVKGHLEKKILAECDVSELTDYEISLLQRKTAPDDDAPDDDITSEDTASQLDCGIDDITKPKKPPF